MNISIGPKTQKLLKKRMKRGGYTTPENAILAGLTTLDQQENLGEFVPGELDRLLAVADEEIGRGEVLDGEKAMRERRRRRAGRAKKAG